MATLDDRLLALEAEIEGYKLDLRSATTSEERSEIRSLIISARNCLTELLKQQNTHAAGFNKFAIVLFLKFILFSNFVMLLN